MEKSTEQKDIEIQGNYCKTIQEVIKSETLLKAFGIIINNLKKYNKSYFLYILEKIQGFKNISDEEEKDIIELLNSKDFQEQAEKILGKLKGFNKEDFEKFSKNYSIKSLVSEIKHRVEINTLGIVDNLKEEVRIEETFEVNGKKYTTLSIQINGEKKVCIKENGKKVEKKDFIFDLIWDLEEINGKIYYGAKIGNKEGYIQLGKENEYKEKIIFDLAWHLKEINGKIYYEVRIGNKEGYIQLGKENEYKEKIIFNGVLKLKEINGKIYYGAIIGNKMGYIEFGKENEYEKRIVFDRVWNLKEINGKIYYGAIILNKRGYMVNIELGKENEYEKRIIFDGAGNLEKDKRGVYFRNPFIRFFKKKVYVD